MTFTKRDITSMISKKINHMIHGSHVVSVINIFIDEMAKELKEGNQIKIDNLGIFKIISMKAKQVKSVVSNKTVQAKSTKSLRFRLAKKFKDFLTE